MAISPFASTKETSNYAGLCRLLVDVGSQVLRSTFDTIHPPATLYTVLGSTSVHYATLQSLYKGRKKVLNPTQWGKLYPTHAPVSSTAFDITLLTVLLRNICGLGPPANGWDRLPLATNISIADDIARVKYYRNTVYGHASQASVDDSSFSAYWQEVREALVRLGGAHFRAAIDNLEHDCMDPDIEEHYCEMMKQWKKDDDSIKDTLEEIENSLDNTRDAIDKIEIEVKEVKEKLSSLTASAEKSAQDSREKMRHDFRDTTEKIEIKMKEIFETLGSLTTTMEKSTDEEEVPPEIRARGLLALRAYKKALSEGRTCIKRVPIMLIGQDRSGKTSLAKSLKGERFNSEEDSTVGIHVDPSYFKMSTEIWKPGEKDEQQNVVRACSYEHHAARLIVKNLSEEESVPRQESLESDRIEHLVQVESVKTSTCAQDENMIDSCSQSVSNSESDDLPVGSVSISMSQDHTISDQQPADNIQTVPDDVASLVEVLLRKDDDSEREEDIYFVLWDFGGQTVYYTTHPLFLMSRAIYLLVFDLSRHLHHRAKSVMKQGMFKKLQDSFRLKTNADYLDFWMSSVASLAIQDKSNSKKTKSDMLPELPPVFLVCTHSDKAYDGGDPRELGRTVFGHLQTKPYKNHLHDVFIVDNTKSGQELECPEVLRLRQEICAVAEELPHMKEAVPIKWLKFEKEMQAKKDEGNKWIFVEEAKEIAGEVCNVFDDEEFTTLLNFLHDQRILIHFEDTPELNKMVVLDIQWLIDIFKEVITIRPFDSKEKKFKELWFRLEKEGVLEEPLLEHVWGPLYHKVDTCQSLIAIMEKFSLLCSWPSSDGSCGKQYLVPSMLMSHPPEEIMELIASAEIPPLFLKFETGQVPPGLFPRLVLQFLQWCKQECTSPEHPQLYHNFVRVYRSEEVNCSVILLCHMSSIEVVVHRDNLGHEMAHRLKSAISSPVDVNHDTFACAVLRQLEVMLESMRREFFWLQNMKYEVSFLCPVCCHGGAVSYCHTHLTRGCKQEECLHFWSESELCCEKIIGCTRYAGAKRNRVLAKDFEPWFSPMRNQLIVDKCDEGNSASVEATTEICLPDNVEQSLQSASCDAKEIVHQLKENLQLDEDVFERLDHRTKKIIRSLAHKAKELKRLDVFKHLREIAPAGTTGPLLPENLPVQDMPITTARDLSIHLAGGDEWMALAEGLGLTASEIRFLDKRTLNPMEIALSLTAKQRFLSVGELYELLNEHGFPMLADLL